MTTITLEVPDELAAQFRIDADNLPEFVREALEAKLAKRSRPGGSAIPPIYQEMVDFLASAPGAKQIIDFKISGPTQERLEELLHKNRAAELTLEERAEVDQYFEYRRMMIVLKASARRVVGPPETAC